jgi:hypothetical protein
MEEQETMIQTGMVYEDLDSMTGMVYVVMKNRTYQFSTTQFVNMLEEHCRKSLSTKEIGVSPTMSTREDDPLC